MPRTMSGETLVFVGEEAQRLRHRPDASAGVALCAMQDASVRYEEGADFLVDYDTGRIRRTPQSRIPDWRGHPAWGIRPFDHRYHENYSNASYTCLAEYRTDDPETDGGAAADADSLLRGLSLRLPERLPRLHRKLQRGETASYVVYGDSISTGAEASAPERAYFERFASALRALYPEAGVRVVMGAKGGESSRGGLQRVQDAVVGSRPDLVTIGYGMNDQNRQPDGANAVPPEEFEANMAQIVEDIRSGTEADIVLLTPCLPNPAWAFASGNVYDYAMRIRAVAKLLDVPISDVQKAWLEELAQGKSHESLLLNNINHPNNYGHAIYARALMKFV